MIISPLSNYDNPLNSVFLAGACLPDDNDWRIEAIKYFEEFGFDGDIIDPRNSNYNGEFEKQTSWEHSMMCKASCILFWIPRTKENPCLITNIEFGEWMKEDNIVVGFPDDSFKNEYIDFKLKEFNKPRFDNLKDAVKEVVEILSRKKKLFFTSDTHFSMQRTLELSYRPFKSVREMDETLISNWNKRITMNDEVIHLGDFGNPEIFKYLNCSKMFFLPGNYERKIEDFNVKDFFKSDRVVQMEEKQIRINGTQYYICHEPINNKFEVPENKFFLYGHIHRLQLVKRNGINVGIDGNRFKPMSLKELEFLRGGVEKYFDENVFIENCK